jgi:hypothetical protein
MLMKKTDLQSCRSCPLSQVRPIKLFQANLTVDPLLDTNANGFKEVDIFAEPTAGKKKATTLSKDDLEIYARRAKVSTYASKLRKKRKMVSHCFDSI